MRNASANQDSPNEFNSLKDISQSLRQIGKYVNLQQLADKLRIIARKLINGVSVLDCFTDFVELDVAIDG